MAHNDKPPGACDAQCAGALTAVLNMDARLSQLQQWLGRRFDTPAPEITVASADASFRRYFRVRAGEQSLIAMDAPPDKEDSRPFVKVAAMMRDIGLTVPRVHEADFEAGFFLLSDLGDAQYLAYLDQDNVEQLYGDALSALYRLQTGGQSCQQELPDYDGTLLLREMNLFTDWYLQRHAGLKLSSAQRQVLDALHRTLIDNALAQPRVFVHRDYHSRNLMWLANAPDSNPGILDFQDAVQGPVSYDLVSLLKDCYIAWPRRQVLRWVEDYYHESRAGGLLRGVSAEQFLEWFDLMGVQRQLKASGIFARLNHRDNKPGYLKDIPRTLNYVFEIAEAYPVLRPFATLMADLGIRESVQQQVQGR